MHNNNNNNNNNIIIAFKGAIRDFLQSPHRAANRLQHVRSSGWAQSCANHVQHIERLSCANRVMCHMVPRDSSAIKFGRIKITFTLALYYWLNHQPIKDGWKPEYPEKTPDDELQSIQRIAKDITENTKEKHSAPSAPKQQLEVSSQLAA